MGVVQISQLDPVRLSAHQKELAKQRAQIIVLCNDLLVRKRQAGGVAAKIVTRPGLLVISAAPLAPLPMIKYCIFGKEECTAEPFTVCADCCGCQCCQLHDPGHQQHANWANDEMVAAHLLALDQLRISATAPVLHNAGALPAGRGGGREGGRGGRGAAAMELIAPAAAVLGGAQQGAGALPAGRGGGRAGGRGGKGAAAMELIAPAAAVLGGAPLLHQSFNYNNGSAYN